MSKVVKIVFIAGTILLVLGIVLNRSGILNVSPSYSFWLDEGDPGFEKSIEVEKVLNSTLPNKEYTLRYYKKHQNPDLVNSLYVQYSDPSFDPNNYSKYSDTKTNSGEFALLGNALCKEAELKNNLGYKAIVFHVTSSDAGVKEFYENTLGCN